MPRLTRRGRLTVTITVVAVLALLAGCTTYLLVRTPVGTALGLPGSPADCTVEVGGETREWSRPEAMTATTVAGVGLRLGATENGVAAAVARGLRQVELREEGDDDSTPVDAATARRIYRGLPDRATPSPANVALARVLLGHDGGALTCTTPALDDGLPREDPNGLGLTPRADALREAMRAVYGKQVLGGFEPQGVDSGHIDGSAHYEGRAIDVFFRPVNETNQRAGWAQAQWAVAHAESLHAVTVIFDRLIWTARRSVSGWRDYVHPSGDDNPVLMHEDHVHVDVAEGQ